MDLLRSVSSSPYWKLTKFIAPLALTSTVQDIGEQVNYVCLFVHEEYSVSTFLRFYVSSFLKLDKVCSGLKRWTSLVNSSGVWFEWSSKRGYCDILADIINDCSKINQNNWCILQNLSLSMKRKHISRQTNNFWIFLYTLIHRLSTEVLSLRLQKKAWWLWHLSVSLTRSYTSLTGESRIPNTSTLCW